MEHEFKVGDKVRVIDHRPSRGVIVWVYDMDACCGKTGVITKKNDNPLWFRVKILGEENDWAFVPEWLTLVESGSKADTAKPRFNPGGRVRVKSREWFDGQPEHTWRRGHVRINEGSRKESLMGRVVTIDKYDEEDNTYEADGIWWKAEWLEPVEAEIRPALSNPSKSISDATIAAISDSFASLRLRRPMHSDLPLIRPTKFLTNIKLD